jgi:hypothetical protein
MEDLDSGGREGGEECLIVVFVLLLWYKYSHHIQFKLALIVLSSQILENLIVDSHKLVGVSYAPSGFQHLGQAPKVTEKQSWQAG